MIEEVIFLLICIVACILWYMVMSINWSCLVGKHEFVYVGQKHGMTRNRKTRELTASQRNIYKCCHCGINKPIEDNDYVEE